MLQKGKDKPSSFRSFGRTDCSLSKKNYQIFLITFSSCCLPAFILDIKPTPYGVVGSFVIIFCNETDFSEVNFYFL